MKSLLFFLEAMEWAKIVKLNNSNYQAWSFSVKALLRRKQLWKHVEPGTPPEPITDAWNDSDERTLATIHLMVDESQYALIRDKTTAKDTWAALKAHHERTTLGQRVTLLRQITNQNFKVGDNMEAYLAVIEKQYARLENSGFEMQECLKVALILRGLPESFNPLTTALEARNEDELTLDLVKVKLLDEAEKLRKRSGSDEQVLRTGGASASQKSVVCYHCGKPGHRKRNCKAYLAECGGNADPKREKAKAKTVRENDAKSFTFMVRSGKQDASAWVIDSGATSHLAKNRNSFVRLDESVRPEISTADGKVLRTAGVGDCEIECVNGRNEKVSITLTGVIFAPGLEGNLISVPKLAEKGVRAEFDADQCRLVYDGSVIATADRVSGLYRLNVVEKSLLVSDKQHNTDCLHTWHRRLGHRDPDAIGEVERRGLASGMKIKPCGIRMTCESCVEGKMARPPFPQAAEKKSKAVLDIVHSDVCGPMTTSPGGCRYYMTMIDDHSRYTVVYFLKEKSEVIEKIREYVRFTETQFGRKPKVIRSDRGGEYTSNALRKFYAEEGIKAEFTAGYAPQQNGVAERRNRTLNEMGLCMLLDAGLPRRFWAEAVNTAAYLQNRLPSSAIGSTPHEIWFGTKPDLQHLKVFGCSAYVWTPPQKRKKFEEKATKMTFVGYASDSKAYRLLNTSTGQIVISRDVRFLELDDEDKNVKDGTVRSLPGECPTEDEQVAVRLYDCGQNAGRGDDSQDEEEFFGFDEDNDDPNEAVPVQEERVAVPVTRDHLRRSQRENFGVPPGRYTDTIGLAVNTCTEPSTYREAIESQDSEKWKAAMDEEMASLRDNETWTLTKAPQRGNVVGCKWVFKCKPDESGKTVRYKARLVAQGFSQKYGTDYDQVFAPVVKQITFRTVLTIASKRQMLVKHIDIKTAYLYGVLQEEIHMKQPPGYTNGDPNTVCLLKRSLYGLKQAARVWNQRIDAALKSMGFHQSSADPCLYLRIVNGMYSYILIYVDDIVVVCRTEQEYQKLVTVLSKSFKIVELGDLTFFLGIHVRRDADRFFLNQKSYVRKLLSRFNMVNCKASRVPMASGFVQQKEEDSDSLADGQQYQSLIGALLYIAVNTRPDIAISTSILGRRVTKPTTADWNEAKRVLRYLKGTENYELHLGGGDNLQVECFVDADWAGEVDNRKSNTGYIFKFGGGLVGWGSRKQTCVSLSSTEAEYIALAECLQELQWVRRLVDDLGEQLALPIVVNEDNQSCIALVAADRISRKSKHIDTKYCFVKDLASAGIISIRYCPTEQMEADLLTKPLGAVKLQQLREAIGILPHDVEEEC